MRACRKIAYEGCTVPIATGSVWDKGYRYGFNGMEHDDDIGIDDYTTEFRQLDTRIGRWFSRDPVFKPYFSSYLMLSNMPIVKIDPRGDDDYFDINGQFLGSDNKKSNNIKIVTTAHISMGVNFYSNPSTLLINANSPDVKNAKLIQNYKFTTQSSGEMMVKIFNFYFTLNTTGNLDDLNGSSFSFINIKPDGDKDFNVNGGASQGRDVMNTSFLSGLNSMPIITIPAKKGKITSELENNKWNLVNTMVHEYFHAKNHKNQASEKTDEGIIQHLDAYKAQIDHSSWKETSPSYKKFVKKNINIYIKKIKDKDKKNEQIKRFKR